MEARNRRVPRRALLYQYACGAIAGLAAMTAGAWLSWPSTANPLFTEGKACCQLDKQDLSWMVALMDFGNVLTPVPSSYFMDWIGRKPTLYFTAFLNIIGSVLIMLADNKYYLYVARLFVGMSKGVAFAVVPIYLAEVANIQIRGALSTMFIGLLNIGMFYDYVLGPLVGYQGLHIANLIIPIVFTIAFFFVPESPYYLSMKNRERKVIKSLSKFRQLGKEEEEVAAEAKLVSTTVRKDLDQKGKFWDILTSRSMRRATLIIALLAMFQRSSGISPTLAYSTIILPQGGGGFSSDIYMVIFSFILVLANYVATPLIDTWGRKKLLVWSAVTSAITQLVAGLFYSFQTNGHDVSNWTWLPYLCVVIFAFTYSLGIGFIPSTLVGEIFPTNVKCYASSVSAMILALTSFAVNRVFLIVAKTWGVEYMYFYFAIACFICTIFCIYFVFETKGKTFAEIQETLKRVSGEN